MKCENRKTIYGNSVFLDMYCIRSNNYKLSLQDRLRSGRREQQDRIIITELFLFCHYVQNVMFEAKTYSYSCLASQCVCPLVCPHVTTRELLSGFLLQFCRGVLLQFFETLLL